jgi:hypothetical protein
MAGRNNQPDNDGEKSKPSRLDQFADESATGEESLDSNDFATMACRETELPKEV